MFGRPRLEASEKELEDFLVRLACEILLEFEVGLAYHLRLVRFRLAPGGVAAAQERALATRELRLVGPAEDGAYAPPPSAPRMDDAVR